MHGSISGSISVPYGNNPLPTHVPVRDRTVRPFFASVPYGDVQYVISPLTVPYGTVSGEMTYCTSPYGTDAKKGRTVRSRTGTWVGRGLFPYGTEMEPEMEPCTIITQP